MIELGPEHVAGSGRRHPVQGSRQDDVVATQAEGTVELLGLTALDQTVPVEDWPALRSRLVGIARDEALAAELGRRNQGRAQQFSLEIVTQRFERLYASLLG